MAESPLTIRGIGFALGGLALLAGASAGAGELREYYRGSRFQAMGGAFTALADDEQAVFLNPAGLAGNRRFATFVNMDVDTSAEIIQAYATLASISMDNLSEVLGKNIYARAQVAPTLLIPNFGIAVLMDGQAALYSRNKALPHFKLGYQNTNGLQFAYGYSFSRGRRSRVRGDFRVGVGAKVLWRRGGYRDVTPLHLVRLANKQETLGGIVGAYSSMAYGLDLGAQYVHPFSDELEISVGTAFTNIGDVTFDSGADPIKGNLSAGFALRYRLEQADVILAYDYRHMLQETDWRKRNHLGVELALPLLSIYAGLNQTYLSAGVGLDLWILRVNAVTYAEELGTLAHQEGNRRYMLGLTAKFDL